MARDAYIKVPDEKFFCCSDKRMECAAAIVLRTLEGFKINEAKLILKSVEATIQQLVNNEVRDG